MNKFLEFWHREKVLETCKIDDWGIHIPRTGEFVLIGGKTYEIIQIIYDLDGSIFKTIVVVS